MINKTDEREKFGEVKKSFRLEGTDYAEVMDTMDDLFCGRDGNAHGWNYMVYNTGKDVSGKDVFVKADYSNNDQDKGEGEIIDFHFYTDNPDEYESVLSRLRDTFSRERGPLCSNAATTLTEIVDAD